MPVLIYVDDEQDGDERDDLPDVRISEEELEIRLQVCLGLVALREYLAGFAPG